MVLEVPAATDKTVFFGSAIDSWEVPLADIGGTGDDAGKGGKYLFLPPGDGTKPPTAISSCRRKPCSSTSRLRPISIGKGTLADAVAYSQLLKAYPLADAAKPTTRYIDGYPKAWKTLPTFDVSYFQLLADAIAVEPPQPKDAAMLAMLASIGIEKGKPFQPDATRAKLLTAAVREAEATMNDGFMNHVVRTVLARPSMAGHQTREQLRLLLLRQRRARLRPPRRGVCVLGDVGAEATGRSRRSCPPPTT